MHLHGETRLQCLLHVSSFGGLRCRLPRRNQRASLPSRVTRLRVQSSPGPGCREELGPVSWGPRRGQLTEGGALRKPALPTRSGCRAKGRFKCSPSATSGRNHYQGAARALAGHEPEEQVRAQIPAGHSRTLSPAPRPLGRTHKGWWGRKAGGTSRDDQGRGHRSTCMHKYTGSKTTFSSGRGLPVSCSPITAVSQQEKQPVRKRDTSKMLRDSVGPAKPLRLLLLR